MKLGLFCILFGFIALALPPGPAGTKGTLVLVVGAVIACVTLAVQALRLKHDAALARVLACTGLVLAALGLFTRLLLAFELLGVEPVVELSPEIEH